MLLVTLPPLVYVTMHWLRNRDFICKKEGHRPYQANQYSNAVGRFVCLSEYIRIEVRKTENSVYSKTDLAQRSADAPLVCSHRT
jgi:hypothetical protein